MKRNNSRKMRRSRRGETLVEILIAVLVASFATLLVAVMFSTAFSADLKAKEGDKTYYEAITEMESMEETGNPTDVKIAEDGKDGITVEVNEYGKGPYSAYRSKDALNEEASNEETGENP